MLTREKYAVTAPSETHAEASVGDYRSPESAAPGPHRHEALSRVLMASPVLTPLLARWPDIGLADCWLAGGAVAQTVWNGAFALAPDHGLSDVDLIYFDASDLSEAAEAYHEARLRRLFADVPVRIDVKNEARVHLWYAAKFGRALAPYTSTEHAISTFPTIATSVGVQPAREGLRITAPFGLADLAGLIVRPNKMQITQNVYDAKVARWRPLWPGLTFVDWDAPS
jgi:uncharacterized protein